MESKKRIYLYCLVVISMVIYYFVPSTSEAQRLARVVSTTHPIYYQLSTGIGLTAIGKTNNLMPNVLTLNRYLPNRSTKILFTIGGGLGYRRLLGPNVITMLGLASYYINWAGHVRGILHPGINIDSTFSTLNYSYKLNSRILWLENRWLFGRHMWRPFLFLAVGGSWNDASSYLTVSTNTGCDASSLPISFESKTNFNLTYGVGAGINLNGRFSIGYRYINVGKVKLGLSPLQTTDVQLSAGYVDAHLILLTLIL